MGLNENFHGAKLPMLPGPAAALLNLDPGTEPNLALEKLDSLLLANGVLAFGPVVGRDFYQEENKVVSLVILDLRKN